MKIEKIKINNIPSIIWGEKSQRIAEDIEIEIPEQSNNIIKLKKLI